MMRSLGLLALVATSIAAPLEERASASPSVTIKNGTVTGTTSSGIDSFSGIPFAQPPVGNLRLRQPQPLTSGFPGGAKTFDATKSAKSCPQFLFQINNLMDLPSDVLGNVISNPLTQVAMNSGEDCLTITVQRPTGTKSTDKLPVIYWIYGGGFESGSSSMYDGSNFIKSSVNLGKPVVYVAVNYRLNGFGFLAGKELSQESNTNLGLRDQRLGLQWVAENIKAFGGDPDKVTIWGESAGAISVADQTLVNRGNNKYKGKALFRAAIMNSGSIIPATDTSSPKAQGVYDQVVANSPCEGNADTLACLRGLDFQTFYEAVSSVPGIFSYQSLDLAYLPRPDPSDNFFPVSPETAATTGQFTKVPVIIGDQEDEGTLFSLVQPNITTNDQFIDYLADYFPSNPNAKSTVAGLLAQYPNQPLLGQPAGSPFRTGSLNSITPQFKRIAAVLGDITFTLTRRAYLDFITNQGVPAWSYLSTFLHGTPVLGTPHGSDLAFSFFSPPNSSVPTRGFHTYYVNFVYHQDPNSADNVGSVVNWPQWTNATSQLLNFQLNQITYLADNFRMGAYDYLKTRASSLRV